MAKTAKYEIDGAKLEELIKAAGYEKCDVSEAIGYSRGYLTECIRSNLIPIVAAKCIETMFKIPYDLYKPVIDMPPEPEQPVKDELDSSRDIKTLTIEEFSNLIYKAMYCAFVDALKVDGKENR